MITYTTELTQGIDWLQFTSSSYDFPFAWDNEYQDKTRGMWGYTRMRTWRDGRVKLWNPDRPEMSNHFLFSASALARVYSDYGSSPWELLASLPEGTRCSRLDVCVDAMRGNMCFEQLERNIANGRMKSRARTVTRFSALVDRGDTLYVGNPTSPKRLRIYDKAAEQKLEGIQWTRIELQLRKPYADLARGKIVENPDNEDVIPGLITGFVDFPDVQDWRRVFTNAPILMKSPEKERSATTEWLMKVVAPSLARHQFNNPQLEILEQFMQTYRDEWKRLHAPVD